MITLGTITIFIKYYTNNLQISPVHMKEGKKAQRFKFWNINNN